MKRLTRALLSFPHARRGGVTIEQGLIATLIGVVIVSVVTTLSATIDPAARHSGAADGGVANN